MAAHPRQAPERCSVLAQARGEPMLGTAFTDPGLLLVEQPGAWGHAGLGASNFDSGAAAALQRRADGAGLRLLAIRRPGRTPDGVRRRWAVSTRPGGPVSWSEFDRDDELLDAPLDGSVGAADSTPTYLVCAHSKRDVCCALRGRPIAGALGALVPGRVWECSHTGGHRFAPIVLALPVGALYGRLSESALPDLVAATVRGCVLPELLRGVIGSDPVGQAAVAETLKQLGLDRPDAVRVLSTRELVQGQVAARVTAGADDYELTFAVEPVPTPFPSCGKPEPKLERQIRLLRFTASPQ